MTQTVIIDIALAAVLVLSVLAGMKKGLLQSLAGLIVLVAAVVGASVVTRVTAPLLADLMTPFVAEQVEEWAVSALEEKLLDEDVLAQLGDLGSQITGGVGDLVDQVLNGDLLQNLPPEQADQLKDILGGMGLDEGTVEDLTGAAGGASGSADGSAEESGGSVAAVLVRTVLEPVISVAVFLLAFVILLAVLKVAVKALDLVVTLPGLRMLNGIGGAAVSALECVLMIFLLAWAAGRAGMDLTPYTEGTKLARFFVENTPVQLLSKLF